MGASKAMIAFRMYSFIWKIEPETFNKLLAINNLIDFSILCQFMIKNLDGRVYLRSISLQ